MEKSTIVSEAVRVLELEGQAILDCSRRLKDGAFAAQFEKAALAIRESLDRGGKVVVTGVGKSGKVGQKIAATLCSTGSLAVYLHPTEGLHGDLGIVRADDVILALSYTGNTEEVVELLPPLKERGVFIIGMGGNTASRLAQYCDAWIDAEVRSEACPLNLAPTTSTTLALALGDALAVSLMQLRGFKAESFAQNHPGGSLGRKLHLKVEDLMHCGDSVGYLDGNASMEEVIVQSTQKKLGGVLVVDGEKLQGLITDGDIRRALKHREKFFSLKAEDIMTKAPITVRPEMMAQAALELMEKRSSQIGVLPVVDEEGCWAGMIRLHDLVQVL